MNCRTLRFAVFAAFLLAALSGGAALAQEQSGAPAKPPAGGSAAPQATAPAPSAPSTRAAPADPTNAEPAPVRRVWTNDDMGGLHRDSSIPNFSGTNAKPAKTSEKPAASAKNKDAKRYQDQITALRAKLPELDDKISQLQGVLNGDTVQSTRTYGGNKIDDWHLELADLKNRREDIETKISALQDEARHNGVPENQIPQ
jgi:uncharacterized protein YukE